MKELDFLQVNDKPKMKQQFEEIATKLFNNYQIVNESEGKSYYFSDLEFYLFSSEHQDYYIHRGKAQGMTGKFWHHQSGVDLTFGDEVKEIWGGILIRGIIDTKGCIPINGCTDVTTELRNGGEGDDGIINGLTLSPIENPITRTNRLKWKQRQGLKVDVFKTKREKFQDIPSPTPEGVDNVADDFRTKKYRAYF